MDEGFRKQKQLTETLYSKKIQKKAKVLKKLKPSSI